MCEGKVYDAVLVHRQPPSEEFLKNHAPEGSHPVFLDREEVKALGCRVVLADVALEDRVKGVVRHDPYSLARILLSWYHKAERH